jgi:hypothetical protein
VADAAESTGYSGTPLARKLGLKADQTVVLVGAPPGWTIENLPDGVRIHRRGRRSAATGATRATGATGRAEQADVLVAFVATRAQLVEDVPRRRDEIRPAGALWIAWPRRAGGHVSDITDNDVRSVALPLGLVDVKVAALDHDWSGLKLVWRTDLRPALGRG